MDQLPTGSRLLEACNICRKRKVKCDRQRPSCAQCSKSQTPCTYTDRIKILKTPRRRPTKAKLLEERLERMESLLRVPVATLNKAIEESSNSVTKENHSTVTNPVEREHLSSPLNSILQVEESISTAVETQDLNEKSATEMVGSSSNNYNAKPSQIFKTLPPKAEALLLVERYMSKFNNVLPLFHPQTFMKLFQDRYEANPHEDPSWWACLNMVLAFGTRLQEPQLISLHDGDGDAWDYIENALSVVSVITLSEPSLSSIQALLGMTLFIQATPLSRSYTLLLSTAIRFGQSIGLHRQEAYLSELAPTEIEQRKRVFWIGYIVDKDISMRSGHPPIQHDDDIDVEFPSDTSKEDAVGYIFLSNGLWPIDFFRLRIKLSIIQGSIHSNLYSAKATRQSTKVRTALVYDLDEALRRWKDSILLDFEPERLKQIVQNPFDIVHLMILYLTYFNCLTLVHRLSFQNMSWKTRSADSVEPFNPRNFSSKAFVIDAARNALQLLKHVPQNKSSLIWVVLQFSVSAIITLLRNVQLNPSLPTALPDFNLVQPFLDLFCTLAQQLHSSSTPISPSYRQDIRQDPREGGVLIELLRMRTFCFALRDHAQLALKATISTNLVGSNGSDAVVTYSSQAGLTRREREALDAKIHRHIQAKAASDSNVGRAAFIQAFETTFHENSKVNGLLLDQLDISSTPCLVRDVYMQVVKDAHVDESASPATSFDSEHAANQHMPSTPLASSHNDSGMWNWWDLIDMDFDSNRHGIGSATYTDKEHQTGNTDQF